jgi:hypothetical protein
MDCNVIGTNDLESMAHSVTVHRETIAGETAYCAALKEHMSIAL